MPAAERARLIQKVLLSLEDLAADELDALWLDEAERRAVDMDGGKVELLPASEVAGKARVNPRFHPAAESEHLETAAF
jgi:hypothetical protein